LEAPWRGDCKGGEERKIIGAATGRRIGLVCKSKVLTWKVEVWNNKVSLRTIESN
jgi:hypothetical protein